MTIIEVFFLWVSNNIRVFAGSLIYNDFIYHTKIPIRLKTYWASIIHKSWQRSENLWKYFAFFSRW